MAKTSHPLLLLRLVVMVLFPASLVQSKVCPPCGNMSVPYPLSTSNDCGDPSYKIRCDTATNTLLFDSLNATYTITSIDPSNQRLVIRPAPFQSPTTCATTDLPHQGIHLNQSLPFNVTSSNTIMLFNCTRKLLLSPLNCSSTSPCHAFVNANTEAASCRNAPICCTFVAGGSTTAHSIRVRTAACSAYRSFVFLDTGSIPVSDWAKRIGVELEWASPRESL